MRDKAIALAEVAKLLQQDRANKVPNLPTRLLAKGVPTKKALKYNRRLIREGRTTHYIDPDRIVNLVTGRATKLPIDLRNLKVKRYRARPSLLPLACAHND